MIVTTTPKLQKSISQSLLGLIESEFFRDFYIVSYLYDKIQQDETVLKLLSKLSTYSQANLQEFIPFVVFIANKFKNQKIKEWMCSQAQLNDIRPYLLIRWASVSMDNPSNETFINMIDSYAVNGKLKCNLDLMSKEQIENIIQKKYQRSQYIPILVQFYHRITKICLKLKSYQNADRNNKLKEYLHSYLRAFQQKLHKQSPNSAYGFTFPIPSQSNYVVNINYQQCLCFSTKQRVPFKIVFETINYDELMSIEQKQYQGSGSTSDLSQKTQSSSSQQRNNDLINLETEQRQIADKMKNYLNEKKCAQSSHITSNLNEASKLGQYTNEQNWQQMSQRIKNYSKFKHFKSLQVRAYIVKSGDDLRQQMFAMQLIKIVKSIFTEFNLPIWIKTYDIIMTSATSGFIEFVQNTTTVSSLKKTKKESLSQIYMDMFGQYQQVASVNFVNSLAGYSILQYLFLIKDRHNGNIMIDSQGHIIHIDFGFLLGSSPGNMGFQSAPFKFPQQYLDIMGGVNSDLFAYFKQLLFLGFTYIRRYAQDIMKFINVTKQTVQIRSLAYYKPVQLQKRFMLGMTDIEVKNNINKLVNSSLGSSMTSLYDQFQYKTNGILY